MITVRHPAVRSPERQYILEEIFCRRLGLALNFQTHASSDTVVELDESRRVIVSDGLLGLPDGDWLTEASMPKTPARFSVPMLSNHASNDVQVLPFRDRSRPPPSVTLRNERTIVIDADLLGSAFFFLSRYEEVARPNEKDRFDRFPSTSSYARRHRLLDRPVVDEYVNLVRSCLRRLMPELALSAPSFRIEVSHDVDLPLKYAWSGAARVLAGGLRDLLHDRRLSTLVARLSDWRAVRHGLVERDPFNTFSALMDHSAARGLRSAFYFICDRAAGNRDALYDVDDPFILDLIRDISSRGHEIGLHASFKSYEDPERTSREFRRLREICEGLQVRQATWGGRQHYLRWKTPQTFRNWAAAGLDYDSTLGFADHAGFRCGTCHEFKPFDIVERRTLNIVERPLVLMDATLMHHMGLESDDHALAYGVALKESCRAHGGVFTMLWHNSNLTQARQWALYLALIDA